MPLMQTVPVYCIIITAVDLTGWALATIKTSQSCCDFFLCIAPESKSASVYLNWWMLCKYPKNIAVKYVIDSIGKYNTALLIEHSNNRFAAILYITYNDKLLEFGFYKMEFHPYVSQRTIHIYKHNLHV